MKILVIPPPPYRVARRIQKDNMREVLSNFVLNRSQLLLLLAPGAGLIPPLVHELRI